MKRKLKMISIIFGIMILTSIASVYAVQAVNSIDVSYDNSTSGLTSTNVKGAIDEIYTQCSTRIVMEYGYIGEQQTFIAPYTGIYKIQLWGAQGGLSKNAGTGNYTSTEENYGSYVSGEIRLNNNSKIYLYVGGAGICDAVSTCSNSSEDVNLNGGYNGGGNISSAGSISCSGGGATDVRIISGSWDDESSLRSRIMVAGGSGGLGGLGSLGGSAGGLLSYEGSYNSSVGGHYKTIQSPADQTEGATTSNIRVNPFGYPNENGSFGKGGRGAGHYCGGSAGGGGWYGGAGSSNMGGGSGGSSYISGHTGCVGVTSKTDSSPKSGCNSGTTNSDCSISPYDYTFTNTIMIDGLGCRWTNELTTDCSGQPQPDGTTTTGHTGNGYAKITLISRD